jgi:putative ABC transport system permease protein
MNFFSLALRNVARNRRRSILTGGVVVFGFAAFALAGGFMAQSLDGLREGTIRSGMGHLQFSTEARITGQEESPLEHGIEGAERVERVLRSDPGVAEVLPRIEFVGLLTNGRRSVPFLGVGLHPAPESRVMDYPKTLASGRWLESESERGVVLGTGLAETLSLAVGDEVTLLATTGDGTLNAVDATVVGLASVHFKELNDRWLATSLGCASELLVASGKVSKIVVVLREPADAGAALPELDRRLRGEGVTLVGRTWEELGVFYHQVRVLYLGIFGFMGVVLVAVVLLAAANTMLMAVTERIREIGTLRALGTRPAAIRRMFVSEGAVLAILGCIAGAILSLVVREALNHSGIMLPPPPGAAQGTPLHVKIYLAAYGAGAITMLATLLLASYFPARRAARISIVDALTHV